MRSLEPTPWYADLLPTSTGVSTCMHPTAVADALVLRSGRPVYRDAWDGRTDKTLATVREEIGALFEAAPTYVDQSSSRVTVWYFRPDGALRVIYDEEDSTVDVLLTTADESACAVIEEWAEETLDSAPATGAVYAIASTMGGYEAQLLDFAGDSLTRENYTPAALEQYDYICGQLNSDTPSGRVVILDGPTGTGKTYMVRGLVHEVADTMFLVVPHGMLEAMVSPSMLGFMLELKSDSEKSRIALVLEDADDVLVPRDAGNMSLISSLLNLGDGLMGAALNLRIIATTNAQADHIDSAVLRPGRLLARVHVGRLPETQARARLQQLNSKAHLPRKRKSRSVGFDTGDEVTSYSLAELYGAANARDGEPD